MQMLVHLMLFQRFLKQYSFLFIFSFFLLSFSDFHYPVLQLTDPFLCIIQFTVDSF